MNLISVLFFILFFSYSIFGQDIQTTEIKILEDFSPKIVDGQKLNDRAVYKDSLFTDRLQQYNVLDFTLKSNYKTKLLAPAKVKAPLLVKLYGNSVCFGFGNYWKTKGDIIYSTTRSKNKRFGIYFNHYSDKYLPAKNSNNNFNAFYKKINSSNSYEINLMYNKRTAVYYKDETDLIDKDFRNRFAFTKLSLHIYSNKKNINRINHDTKIFFSDFNEFSENHFHVSSQLKNILKDLPLKINTRFDSYLNYNSSDSPFRAKNINYFDLSPNYSVNKFDIDMTLGFNIIVKSSESNLNFIPNVKFSKELVKDIIKIETGFLHSQHKNSLKILSEINPYIHSYGMNQSIDRTYLIDQNLNFTEENNFYFSLRNVLSDNEVLNTSFGYSVIEDFLHFIRIDNPSYSRYQSNYVDLKQFNLDIEYFKKINSFLSVDLACEIYKWNEEVFNKPNVLCDLKIPINLRKKINIIPSVLYFSAKKSARILSSQMPVPYELPITEKMGPYFYANLLFEYNYSKQLAGFLSIHNLTNNKKDIWLGYREPGLNILFGIKTSF